MLAQEEISVVECCGVDLDDDFVGLRRLVGNRDALEGIPYCKTFVNTSKALLIKGEASYIPSPGFPSTFRIAIAEGMIASIGREREKKSNSAIGL